MFLSEEEKKLYEKTLTEEKEKQQLKELEERKEKILVKAKEDAKPIKDKIKKGLKFLERIQINTEFGGDKK